MGHGIGSLKKDFPRRRESELRPEIPLLLGAKARTFQTEAAETAIAKAGKDNTLGRWEEKRGSVSPPF